MAVAGSGANPIIVEPTASSASPKNSPTSPSLVTNSSSESIDPSRPQSQCSSTSQSDTSGSDLELRRIPKSVSPASQAPLATLSPSSTLVPSNTALSNSPPHNGNIPRSLPEEPAPTAGTSSRFPGLSSLIPHRVSGHWLLDIIGIIIAVTSLAASLASLIWLGVRTYKLAVSSAVNGAFSACTGLIQANLATLETSSPKCKSILTQGPAYSPYQLGKRALHASLTAASRVFERRQLTKPCAPSIGCQREEVRVSDLYSGATLVCVTATIGILLLAFVRHRARSRRAYQSPARSDVQIMRHNHEGPEKITDQNVRVVRHNPGDDPYAGQLRQRIRNLQNQNDDDSRDNAVCQPYNSSTDTLVNPWPGPNPSKFTVTNNSADEKHEGLIELETTGDNRTFFDPETDDFLHFAPWKSTHSGEEDLDHNRLLKSTFEGSVKRALARMATGGAALAGGKKVDNTLQKKLTEADEKDESMRIPQRAGDCLAGQVTNERPRGWPQTV